MGPGGGPLPPTAWEIGPTVGVGSNGGSHMDIKKDQCCSGCIIHASWTSAVAPVQLGMYVQDDTVMITRPSWPRVASDSV